ncbi:MAG: aspartate--tRNA ligase [Bacteroidales bacterium]|nr:aspartate--tRNA ligase [Bacteroidales bacterium]MCF8332912.1 aspartate--tRNA ligase [Bacteroidales bacterium]
MLRTHTCGELRLENENEKVTLTGWVQRSRDLGGMTFIDLRDRYGITQLVFDVKADSKLAEKARKLGREFVIQVKGNVAERSNKNKQISTGDIEVLADSLTILNKSKVPPFTIEDETDGGEELRMKYRYLDLRRKVNQDSLVLRHKMSIETRKYLNNLNFVEIETPYLIKSTPEGARDFVVPSRLTKGAFYALPQSPQTFKQLLMISGYDKYFQLVKCFRDEDFRSDRQPEFTQIDCEMSFVEQDDVLNHFEGLSKHLFKVIKNVEMEDFPRMPYEEAIRLYGSDKPDIRFGMQFVELNAVAQGKGFKVFDSAELVVGIKAEGSTGYTRKQLDSLTDFVKKPQIGAKGLVYLKYNEDGSFKSSVDKFFSEEDFKAWAQQFEAKPGDLMLILAGEAGPTRTALNELRLEMGNQLGLRDPNVFKGLWVVDFPLLEWDEETKRYHAMHHPFTSPKDEDIHLLEESPEKVRANAYDMVINGVEIGGGSIRIHDRELQDRMFSALGFSKEEAHQQFGFLLEAFEYGAPPHGGIAFGFDRWVSLFAGRESIRDVIAFPKNNAGRDIMIDSPSTISEEQLKELNIQISKDEKKE